MTKTASFLFLALCGALLAPVAAQAASTATTPPSAVTVETVGTVTPADVEMAKTYLLLAKTYGAEKLSRITKTDSGTLAFEYLVEYETAENWKKMVTIKIVPSVQDKIARNEHAASIIDKYNQVIEGDLTLTGEKEDISVLLSDNYKKTKADGKKEEKPVAALYHYMTGTGMARFDIVQIVHIDGPSIVEITVKRRNGSVLSDKEMETIKQIYYRIRDNIGSGVIQ